MKTGCTLYSRLTRPWHALHHPINASPENLKESQKNLQESRRNSKKMVLKCRRNYIVLIGRWFIHFTLKGIWINPKESQRISKNHKRILKNLLPKKNPKFLNYFFEILISVWNNRQESQRISQRILKNLQISYFETESS